MNNEYRGNNATICQTWYLNHLVSVSYSIMDEDKEGGKGKREERTTDGGDGRTMAIISSIDVTRYNEISFFLSLSFVSSYGDDK